MITVTNLSKCFTVHSKEPGLRGTVRSLFHRKYQEKWAVKDVSLTVKAGEIVGLVGANGAGKTTLVKMLSGILYPTSGTAEVLGCVPWERSVEFRRNIALIMGQKAQLWWDLPAADCFILLREIYQIPHAEFSRTLDNLVTMLEVKDQLKVQIRRLSLGERMKMELIAALLHSPKVVYLDEPTIGLDLSAQKVMRRFILDYKKEHNPAMFLTSHYMEDIEALCERLVIIRDGGKVYDGPTHAITDTFAQSRVVRFECDRPHTDPLTIAPELGEILEQKEERLSVKTTKKMLAGCISAVLAQRTVVDIAIEEEDIGTVIEAIMREGRAVHA
jgi:ABC-2 type transport system ATP-binding protein